MTVTTNTIQAPTSDKSSNFTRYFQFALLLIAAGAIYPLLYMRQNFEQTLLMAFDITATDLADFNSILGLIYVSTYIPSGWLADRFSAKKLIVFSVGAVGLLGFWYSTFPGYYVQVAIFIGWGLCAGLTFWAALIKSVNLLAREDEQGRFFGILDGGRGLVEAVLASIAVGIFAYYVGTGSAETQADKAVAIEGFRMAIYMYSTTCLIIAVLVSIFLSDDLQASSSRAVIQEDIPEETNIVKRTWDDLVAIFSIPQVWVMMLIILTGYMQFWATYSVSTYLQDYYSAPATVAAFITMTKLWMRPIGGIGGGFLADWLSKKVVLGISMIIASLTLAAFAYFPASTGAYMLIVFVICLGISTYAIRGLYWSFLDDCRVPPRALGLGIGVISMVGYTPDIFLPQINNAISAAYPGNEGTQLYFMFIACSGLVGAVAAFCFKARDKAEKVTA